uniref:Uncharacterized protein n=1 Tax=Setaria digitata TaxID=48799 RepID=A0A915PCS3_9BILA
MDYPRLASSTEQHVKQEVKPRGPAAASTLGQQKGRSSIQLEGSVATLTDLQHNFIYPGLLFFHRNPQL